MPNEICNAVTWDPRSSYAPKDAERFLLGWLSDKVPQYDPARIEWLEGTWRPSGLTPDEPDWLRLRLLCRFAPQSTECGEN
jgi:hypothetical protein